MQESIVSELVQSSIKSPVGRLLIVSPRSDKSITHNLAAGMYEPIVQNLIATYIKPESVCLDLGANFGQHTALRSCCRASRPSGNRPVQPCATD